MSLPRRCYSITRPNLVCPRYLQVTEYCCIGQKPHLGIRNSHGLAVDGLKRSGHGNQTRSKFQSCRPNLTQTRFQSSISNMQESSARSRMRNKAVVAFGSNMKYNRRVENIEAALKLMRQSNLRITKLSHLYETKPMYHHAQDPFLNGVCEIETELNPVPLLHSLQHIENELGRKRTIANGPRTIDLDILLYNDEQISHPQLDVPHKLMLEREFVLRPLNDILPDHVLPPGFAPDNPDRTIREHLNALSHDPSMSPIVMIRPVRGIPLLRSQDPTRRTMIMAIFNATPDSFSGENMPKETDARQMFGRWFGQGADIIDFGGQSTRPGAELLSAEEELARVLPYIIQCKDMKREDTVVSVDTFYARVARKCIEAGADIINDVSGGLLDDEMLPTVAELNKTIVLMHMRGNPKTMTTLTEYPDGVVNGVRRELGERVKAAHKAGIPPWRIILDPGIGFAKTEAQNLELLRSLAELRKPPSNPDEEDLSKYPWLIGPSRKGFIGKITGVEEAKWRQFGTAAAVTACVAGGAEIVRVHDVTQMVEAVRLADGIYRSRDSSFNKPARSKSASPSRAQSSQSTS